MAQISKKVILVGHFGVGKTSLIKQFVHSRFSEEYLTTIGVNIEKKDVKVNETDLTMIIWDIAGEVTVEKTPMAHMLGAHGIIYVFDLTRESTWLNIEEQIENIKEKLPTAPIRIVANKKDLVSDHQLETILSSLSIDCHYSSSAKTGEKVEEMFLDLANAIVK